MNSDQTQECLASGRNVLFVHKVDVASDIPKFITFRRTDIPKNVALEFCKLHSLDSKFHESLIKELKQMANQVKANQDSDFKAKRPSTNHATKKYPNNSSLNIKTSKDISSHSEAPRKTIESSIARPSAKRQAVVNRLATRPPYGMSRRLSGKSESMANMHARRPRSNTSVKAENTEMISNHGQADGGSIKDVVHVSPAKVNSSTKNRYTNNFKVSQSYEKLDIQKKGHNKIQRNSYNKSDLNDLK